MLMSFVEIKRWDSVSSFKIVERVGVNISSERGGGESGWVGGWRAGRVGRA